MARIQDLLMLIYFTFQNDVPLRSTNLNSNYSKSDVSSFIHDSRGEQILVPNMQQTLMPSPPLESSPRRLVSAQTLFSVHPIDPPLSPPPTSPLPALPDLAAFSPSRNSLPVGTLPRTCRPRRHPRHNASQPNLRPYGKTSPTIKERQSNAEQSARNMRMSLKAVSPKLNQHQENEENASSDPEIVRLVDSWPGITPTFSDDVLFAVSNLFQHPRSFEAKLENDALDMPNSNFWQHNLHSSDQYSFPKQCHTTLSVPLARFPPVCRRNLTSTDSNSALDVALDSSLITASSITSTSKIDLAAVCSTCKRLRGHPVKEISGKTVDREVSLSVQAEDTLVHSVHSKVKGYHSKTFATLHPDNEVAWYRSFKTTATSSPSQPDETDTCVRQQVTTAQQCSPFHRDEKPTSFDLFSVPYANTLGKEGPKPRTYARKTNPSDERELCFSRHTKSPASDRHSQPDVESGDDHVVTEEALKQAKLKRMIWATITVILVLIATAGILGGIIWKLYSLR